MYAIIPNPVVKTLLMQNELGERRGKWMAILQEFYIEIRPMMLIRGYGLAKLIAHTAIDQSLVSYAYTSEGIISNVWY